MEVDINGIGYKISGIAWRIENEIIDKLRKLHKPYERTYGLPRRDKCGRTFEDYIRNPHLIDRLAKRSSSETEHSQECQKQQKRKQL